MHSSRMRTVCCSSRLLGVSVSARGKCLPGGVSAQGGVCPGGVYTEHALRQTPPLPVYRILDARF